MSVQDTKFKKGYFGEKVIGKHWVVLYVYVNKTKHK